MLILESILTSIKKLLGIQEDYTHFDADIIMHINTVFMTLSQLGIGPPKGFSIGDDKAIWADYISGDNKNFESIKTYIYLKVKLVFDPPLSSSVIESINRTISELEWRLNVEAETPSNQYVEMGGLSCGNIGIPMNFTTTE